VFFVFFSSCQKDLTIQTSPSAFTTKSGANDDITIVKKESLPNDILKTTYSNGIQVYLWAAEKREKPESLSAPLQTSSQYTCNTGINDEGLDSEGCCCLNFHSFGQTPLPGGFSVNGFFFDLNTYYEFPTTTPHDYKFYLKITPETSWAGPVVWYEGYLPWEKPQLASCSNSINMVVAWDAYPFCSEDVNVNAKKVFKRLDIPSTWSTCVETDDTFYYQQPDTGPCL
jgi:hypothetical protein